MSKMSGFLSPVVLGFTTLVVTGCLFVLLSLSVFTSISPELLLKIDLVMCGLVLALLVIRFFEFGKPILHYTREWRNQRDAEHQFSSFSKSLKTINSKAKRADRLSSIVRELSNGHDESKNVVLTAFDDLEQTVSAETNSAVDRLITSGQTATQLTEATELVGSQIEEVSPVIGELIGRSEKMLTSATNLEEVSDQLEERITTSLNLIDQHADKANKTRSLIEQLSTTAQEIEGFVGLINDITARTRLLALNATIEAEHAGEMGKGFAVVAAEVKTLSEQTSDATDKISEYVTTMGDVVQNVVENVSDTDTMVARMKEASGEMASTLEKQNHTLWDIESAIRFTDENARNVFSSFENVVATSRDACSMATDVQINAMTLESDAEMLRGVISGAMASTKSTVKTHFPTFEDRSDPAKLIGEEIEISILIKACTSDRFIAEIDVEEAKKIEIGQNLTLRTDNDEEDRKVMAMNIDGQEVLFSYQKKINADQPAENVVSEPLEEAA